jgi:DNA-binding response OmpR family regulator
MARLSYDTAETLIYDPVAANRTATRSLLYTLGFRRIETVSSLRDMHDSMKRRPPDLVLCEAQGVESELCQMIQGLRQGATGYNPFVVVIVTAWENSGALVSSVINSGADDLILRPFSASTLGTRILSHVERRKSFVITTDYVGPDRNREPDKGSNVQLFHPPNSLKLKVKEPMTSEEATQKLGVMLKSAREMLNTEKLRRDAFQVCILWRLVQDNPPGTQRHDADLAKLRDLTRSVLDRCAETDFQPAVEHCEAVLGAVEGLEMKVDRNASMHLLGHAALSLNQFFTPEKSSTDHLAEIDSTVAVIKSREEQALAS